MNNVGNPQSLNVRTLPPRVPRPNGIGSPGGGVGGKGKGKASVHDSGTASGTSGDDQVGGSGAGYEPSPDVSAESDVGGMREDGAALAAPPGWRETVRAALLTAQA